MSLFTTTTAWLLKRLRRADKGWEKAMAHPKYRDEPLDEAKGFTETEKVRMFWAEAWRGEYHWCEGELYQQPEIRAGMCLGLSVREETTKYEQ